MVRKIDLELLDVQNQEYRTAYEEYNALHITNLTNQDTVLIQISVGLLAVVTALGKDILLVNKCVSLLFLGFMTITVLQIVAGYFVSNRFFIFIKQKLTENYNNNHDLNEGLKSSISGKINDILNITQYVTFVLGIVAFLTLLFIYLGGLTNGK